MAMLRASKRTQRGRRDLHYNMGHAGTTTGEEQYSSSGDLIPNSSEADHQDCPVSTVCHPCQVCQFHQVCPPPPNDRCHPRKACLPCHPQQTSKPCQALQPNYKMSFEV